MSKISHIYHEETRTFLMSEDGPPFRPLQKYRTLQQSCFAMTNVSCNPDKVCYKVVKNRGGLNSSCLDNPFLNWVLEIVPSAKWTDDVYEHFTDDELIDPADTDFQSVSHLFFIITEPTDLVVFKLACSEHVWHHMAI